MEKILNEDDSNSFYGPCRFKKIFTLNRDLRPHLRQCWNEIELSLMRMMSELGPLFIFSYLKFVRVVSMSYQLSYSFYCFWIWKIVIKRIFSHRIYIFFLSGSLVTRIHFIRWINGVSEVQTPTPAFKMHYPTNWVMLTRQLSNILLKSGENNFFFCIIE